MEKSLKDYRENSEEILNLALLGKKDEALDKFTSIEEIANEFESKLKDLSDYNIKLAENAKNQNDYNYKMSLYLFFFLRNYLMLLYK